MRNIVILYTLFVLQTEVWNVGYNSATNNGAHTQPSMLILWIVVSERVHAVSVSRVGGNETGIYSLLITHYSLLNEVGLCMSF
jgi:hypothetical protein